MLTGPRYYDETPPLPRWVAVLASIGLHVVAAAGGVLLMVLGAILARWVTGGAQ